jgi:hypothetical protein
MHDERGTKKMRKDYKHASTYVTTTSKHSVNLPELPVGGHTGGEVHGLHIIEIAPDLIMNNNIKVSELTKVSQARRYRKISNLAYVERR